MTSRWHLRDTKQADAIYDHSPLQVTEAAIVFMSRPAQPLGTGHAARGAASAAYQLIRACGMPYIRRENSSPVT